jgi:PAS domain S-box-containing protein
VRDWRHSWVPRALGLLAALAFFGTDAPAATPAGGHALGVWPVGIVTATYLVTHRPPTWLLTAVVGAVSVVSIHLGGRPVGVAVGCGLGLTAAGWVSWRLVSGGRRERPTLRDTADLARFLVASVAGAAVAALGAAVTSVLTGYGLPPVMALAVGAAALLSELTVVPIFCRLRPHAPLAGRAEQLLQWLVLVVLTPAVFLPQDFPSVVFAVIPLLVWSALRSGAYQAMAQLLAVLACAIPFTTFGYGPFANAGPRFGLSVDGQGILLSGFGAVCALVVLPLVLTVGEQLENARQAAAERDKVRNIVDGASGVAIIGTDELGRVTLFNPGAERLLGYTAGEMLGRTTEVLHSPLGIVEKAQELGVEPTFLAVGGALVDRGATEMKLVRKDGVVRSHRMSLNRVEDDRGEVTGYVSTSEDVTDRVQAERRLRESLDAERRAVERLREVDQVKDAFVSSVSHELRTPITSILGYTELLEDEVYGPLTAAQLDAVRRLSGNSTRLLSLIDDLLTLSRVQEGGLALDDEVVDLRDVVRAAVAVVSPTAERQALALTVRVPEAPVPFLGDRDMLERVLINLVGNAAKFTPPGGRVSVTLADDADDADDADAAVIAVADTGIGIPADEQDRLFTRFFRSSLAQQQAIPGSGLGLSIARAIVEQHGGSMSVDSAPGVGTTFRVRLPAPETRRQSA